MRGIDQYLPLAAVADSYDVSCRTLQLACRRILSGQAETYRGAPLKVRLAPSRAGGGRSGAEYEIQVASLPAEIQARFNTPQRAVENPWNINRKAVAEQKWRLNIIYSIVQHPPGSPERRAAFRQVLARKHARPDGTACTLTESTLRRWVKTYDADSAGLRPKVRSDKGIRRTIISEAAECAIPFDAETWQWIAADLRNYVRGHWKEGVTYKLIKSRAATKLRELVAAAGFDHCHTLPDSVFSIPRRFIEAERHYANVSIFRKDRKRFDDEQRFRIKRSRADLKPMEWIVGDVHPVDIVMQRDDGSTAHGRIIGWLDVATNRMWIDLVLCEAGTGVRNADVVQSFLRMVAAWGMPETLYIDNGREYRFAEKLDDALQLVAQLRGDDGRAIRTVRALPHNAAAKPIESMFRIIERLLQDVPGHTGGDRMNKKTERIGRPTKAFPGTVDQLGAIVRGRIMEYEALPMRGALKGRSPRQAWQEAIDSGWAPVALDPLEILSVFASDRICTIRQQVITYDNRRWTCDELDSYFEPKIIARIPDFGPASKLLLLHIKTRKPIGFAEPVPEFAFGDPDGARYSAAKGTRRRAAVIALERSAPKIDTMAEGLRLAAQLPPSPAVAPIAAVSISAEAKAIGQAMIESPEARRERERVKREASSERQNSALEKIASGAGEKK